MLFLVQRWVEAMRRAVFGGRRVGADGRTSSRRRAAGCRVRFAAGGRLSSRRPRPKSLNFIPATMWWKSCSIFPRAS